MPRRSTRKEMVLLLALYAAVMAIMGLNEVVDHFDQPLFDLSSGVIVTILFGAAAVLMFLGKLLGYYAMMAALAIQALLELLSVLQGLSSVSVNGLAASLGLIVINLFLIIWLSHGGNRIVS